MGQRGGWECKVAKLVIGDMVIPKNESMSTRKSIVSECLQQVLQVLHHDDQMPIKQWKGDLKVRTICWMSESILEERVGLSSEFCLKLALSLCTIT